MSNLEEKVLDLEKKYNVSIEKYDDLEKKYNDLVEKYNILENVIKDTLIVRSNELIGTFKEMMLSTNAISNTEVIKPKPKPKPKPTKSQKLAEIKEKCRKEFVVMYEKHKEKFADFANEEDSVDQIFDSNYKNPKFREVMTDLFGK